MRYYYEFKEKISQKIATRDWKWLLAMGIFAYIGIKILANILGGAWGVTTGIVSIVLIPIKIIIGLISAFAGLLFVIFLIGFVVSWFAGRGLSRRM